jgi:acyl carrier protein
MMTAQGGPSAPTAWPSLPEPYSVDQILGVIADSVRVERDTLTPATTLESLNIASLDMVDILFEMEERYNVYIPMGDELSHVVYLGDLIGVLANLMLEGEPAVQSKA